MNFVADECCDALLIAGLRADGHDVVSIGEIAPSAEDETVLRMAVHESRILLTEDKDFGELVIRLKLPAYGILLIRIHPADSTRKLARLRELLATRANDLPGKFVVIEETKTRFRSIKSP
jgi:predicted nuclease of predicted toxin-antitoxin system